MRYRNKTTAEPRIITAKFDSICAETGSKISKGTECLYYPSDGKVYSLDSKQSTEFRNYKMDIDVLGANY